RDRRGYDALSEGLIAAAAGDAGGALRLAKKAAALLDSPPIAKLLTAQAAELTGDTTAAKENFQALAKDPKTALLGIRGLMGEARRRGDSAEALRLADEAYGLRPEAEGLLAQRLELQIESDCWADAEATVREAVRRKEMSAEEGAERRSVMFYEQARLADRAGDAASAQSLLQESVKLNPHFVAGTAKLVELLGHDGKIRRGARLIEKLWAEKPHPSLAAAYRALEPELEPLAQVKRFESLAAINPEHGESHIALAEAALAAELWGEARAQLQRVIESDGLTPRLCRLMATLEESEYEDHDKARHWLAQTASASPDVAWLCNDCGTEAPAWQGRCGQCGGFNTLSWQTPPRITRLVENESPEMLDAPPAE
ncbi:MAG TPA: heme biosynthesis protein HemY, partial [Rhodospirillaceae bacterium]|nr:heme biosynthesis protein HemY [Rhodospirillaceae bacterium]